MGNTQSKSPEYNKYSEGKIYVLICNKTGKRYYGSTTTTLKIRLYNHINTKSCISREIIDNGSYTIELVKLFPCGSKYELETEEGIYIRNNPCINVKIPLRTQMEYK